MDGIFNRLEYKYKMDRATMKSVTAALASRVTADPYSQGENGFYVVNNIYLDTQDDWFIRNSLDKPRYKEKMRVRYYGDVLAGTNSPTFIEIKKNFMKNGNKRRVTLPAGDIWSWVHEHKFPDAPNVNQQILREMDIILKQYGPVYKTALFYDRRAFFSKEYGKSLRITYDYNIRYRNDNVNFHSGSAGQLIYPKDHYILEVKFVGMPMPMWFSRMLAEHGLVRQPFSKIGISWRHEQHSKRDPDWISPYGWYDPAQTSEKLIVPKPVIASDGRVEAC